MNKEEMIAKFKIFFPELANTDPALLDLCYDLANSRVKAGIWKQHYVEGFLYLMAHYVVMRTGGKDGGPITEAPLTATSKTVGKLSIGYSDTSGASYADAGEFAWTVYGKHYYDLRKLIRPTGIVV